ncbi:aldose 1-epimerase family protein [Neolewinella agarilytica]|uniref:Galactose mutarotase n=1 Tax=Neolewinella agarilytica TaxID=478744 RepID=A0A1H9BKT9_9BACT|nr:aldose 1-epimerase family protein [Neolewinella agarilytica]SEP89582.1 Galactose mutarotase [Neolewinella agarilytica]
MRHALENHRLSISINEIGAELASIVNLDSGREYVWQADPDVWGSSAPVLFPIIGMLADGKTMIDGQEYRIPKHGMVRNNPNLELFYHSEDRLTFRLCYSEETLKLYPYKFDFRITYRLRNEHIIVYHEVMNVDDKPMFFNLGAHPAFRVPFIDGEDYSDYFLRFEHKEAAGRYSVLPNGTVGDVTRPVPWQDGNILPLTHELFAKDALVFKDLSSRSITLESKITGPVLKMDYAGWTHLGIWAKPNGDFVCIEPWIGLADTPATGGQFMNKEGLIELEPGQTYEMSYDIKVL